MNKFERGFIGIKNDIFNQILLLDLTGRELKVILLILRLTIGCNRKWARILLCEFSVLNISSSHIQEVIESLIDSKLIAFDKEKGLFCINEDYILSEFHQNISAGRIKLNSLINTNLSMTSQKRKNNFTNSGSITTPKEEKNTSQNGKSDAHGVASLKDILKDKIINSDIQKDKIAINSSKGNGKLTGPNGFTVNSAEGFVALEAWNRLEGHKPKSFGLYLKAALIVPSMKVLQWVSEIEQDNTIVNKGAVFATKYKEYLQEK